MAYRIGIVSYNIYCNFTNYGSALQSWALYTTLTRQSRGEYEPVLVDYCPDILLDKDPLNPFRNMWDQDEESRRLCEWSMPAIRENYDKFERFYRERFVRTGQKYTSANFLEISENEKIEKFICGSDTIFCPDEFGFDDGYWAEFQNMIGHSVAYAASFGDPTLTEEIYREIGRRVGNFKAIGLRERQMLSFVADHTTAPVRQVIDPTLLLTASDYDAIAAPRIIEGRYLLLYSRRYNKAMYDYADRLAQENGWKVVDISLRADYADRHIMCYEAGVEEFLSLIKYAEFVVTNSFHGSIFCIQYRKPFYVFVREQSGVKIPELLNSLGLSDRLITEDAGGKPQVIDYDAVHKKLEAARKDSLEFLTYELEALGE